MSAPSPSPSPGKAFEGRVADVYQALGYQVTPNVQLPGKQTDLIARRQVEGGPLITLAIECKDERSPVGSGAVLEFVARVVAQRADSTVSSGVLVSSSGFTADGRAGASNHPYVTLLSWEQLASQILDVRRQLEEVVTDYENSPIYQDYLPLAIELLSWSTLTSTVEAAPALSDLLANWMGAGGTRATLPRTVFVLADFGAGKTTLMRYLQYDRAKAYLAGRDLRVPLYVPLRSFRQSSDLTALLRSSFRDAFYWDPPGDLLWRRIREGQFYVLLDGFDEMVERSDMARRVDLFHQLLEVLRSPSPSILTSRPSYFVERGELDGLLSTLREYEAGITKALPSKGGNSTAADRLRRKLVDINRDNRPLRGATDRLKNSDVQVIRLMPLDRDRVEKLVHNRSAELEKIGAAPNDLVDFIDRTYDLTDLATRPLLLTLIIDSVLVGGIDLHDTATYFGASGLYEVYTRAKLDLDIAKGRTRQGGLSLEARRMLAEELAVEMYEKNTLEVDFQDVLKRLLSDKGEVREDLAAKRLSVEEVATDFATCSFVTLDQDGKCRFIHKSFRGFFVARVIKDQIDDGQGLLAQWVEREVLYFLGGFAPTHPGVGERLWAKFLHADRSKETLRRNLLVAFLYSKPGHDSRRIDDGDIADAEFGRLHFDGTRMRRTAWRECTVTSMELDEVDWKAIDLLDAHVVDIAATGGDVELCATKSIIESLKVGGTAIRLQLDKSSLDGCTARAASMELTVRDGEVRKIEATDTKLHCRLEGEEGLVGTLDVSNCRVDLGGQAPAKLSARGSVLSYGGDQEATVGWELRSSLIAFPRGASPHRERVRSQLHSETRSKPDFGSIVLAEGGVAPRLLSRMPCGVFGAVASDGGRAVLPVEPLAWGVLRARDHFEKLGLPIQTPGCRLGRLLLVKEEWYERETAKGGRLEAVSQLKQLALGAGDGLVGNLGSLLIVAKSQFDSVLDEKWPEFES